MNKCLLAVLVFCASGCQSTTIIENKETLIQVAETSSVPASPTRVVGGRTSLSESHQYLCEKRVLPAIPQMPDLPLDKIANLKQSSHNGLDDVLKDHIRELRAYSKELQRQMTAVSKQKCKDYIVVTKPS